MNPGWARFCQTVAARGDHPALLMGDLVVRFADLGRKARRVASALAAQGVRPGDRVILRMENGVDAMTLPAALWAVGAVPVLVPLDVQPGAVADIVARTLPRLTLTEAPEGGAE